MAKSRATSRRAVNIWPGFVDALSTLVLVVVFALMIFVIAQQVLTIALDETEQSRNALDQRVIELTADIESCTAVQGAARLSCRKTGGTPSKQQRSARKHAR